MDTTASPSHAFTLQPDEKLAPVMIYTASNMCWGSVILKESIRPSTWLRTPAIPRFIRLREATMLRIAPGSSFKPISMAELHIPSSQVIAYHLKPPDADPLDYDPKEPMRKLEPVAALVGEFRFDGVFRMSTHSDIERFLDVAKEAFLGMYDVTISLPILPAFRQIRIPFTLIRGESVLYSAG